MTDIVERLREGIDPLDIPEGERLMDEAAAEIERLQLYIKERLRAALEAIDSIAVVNARGAIGRAQVVARAALAGKDTA